MPLSAAERQKRYKEKMKKDPEKYEEYKRKKRVNYHTKKKLVKDLTPKEKYNARVIWRLRKKNLRANQKNLNHVLGMTPPSSPSILLPDEDHPQIALQNSPLNDDNTDMSGTETPKPLRNSVAHVSKKSGGRKKIRRDRSKLYRENLRLQEENEKLRKKFEKYKKRYQRSEHNKKEKKEINETEKYKKLSNAIKERYQKIKKHKEKKIIKDIFEGIDVSGRQEILKDSLELKGPIRTTIKVAGSNKLKKTIESFFQRDDVSRATAGKKETITRHGQKLQRRYLLDTMKNLYKTFILENPGTKCSYYYLTRNRPFNVIKPTVSGREMCLCKTHINPVYKASALKNKGVISTDDINKLITATVCNPKVEACMYGTCNQCCHLKIEPNDENNTSIIRWKEWARIEELYEKEGNKMKAFKNVKQEKEGTVKELMTEFNKELKLLKKHVYNMKIQFINFRQAIDNLQPTEAVIVADFSENYSCKLHEEVQAHHFGGSRRQVSLHTVVVYIPKGENNKKVESYCTVSSNTNHQPAAIWAHLDPILKDIRCFYPEITTIHFFTDGPFSQYRQKQNFYFSSTALFDYGFKTMTWSFFEAGHGKGPADGIGGYLKRSADDLVARGEDITCAYKFYEVLKDVSKVKLYLISSDEIENIAKQIPNKIQPLKGTKNVHQIFTAVRGELKYRNLSCFCNRGFCECLSPKVYRPIALVTASTHMKKHKKVDSNIIMDKDETKTAEVIVNETETSTENAKANEIMPELEAETGKDFYGNVSSRYNQLFDVPMSSDEDLQLNNYSIPQQKVPLEDIGLLELNRPRCKNVYNIVYNTPDSSDDEQITACQNPSTSTLHSNDKENRGVRRGDFLLVNVKATKGKLFKYACIVDDLHDDGEIRVTFLRRTKKKNTFRLEQSDISDIDYTDIVKILPEPTAYTKRGQQYFMFKNDVGVFEK